MKDTIKFVNENKLGTIQFMQESCYSLG